MVVDGCGESLGFDVHQRVPTYPRKRVRYRHPKQTLTPIDDQSRRHVHRRMVEEGLVGRLGRVDEGWLEVEVEYRMKAEDENAT